jgi:hypothetical protein
VEHRKGTVFLGLREGQFWKFKCSYKYLHGEVDKYRYVLQSFPPSIIRQTHPKSSTRRTPSWTDRVLYVTHTDSPDALDISNITNLLYTSIPSYTTSDHVRTFCIGNSVADMYLQKPIVCILLLPPSSPSGPASSTPPTIRLPKSYSPTPDPRATLKRCAGRTLDRIIGICWWLLILLGAGSGVVGVFNFCLGIGAWSWWRSRDSGSTNSV